MLPHAPKLRSAKRSRLHVLRGRVGLGLVACLSVLAGMTDAIGFLATGDFVSFMSGNTTRLAVAVSEHDPTTVGRLSLAVVCFVAGNALGIVLARGFKRRAAPLLIVVAALLGFAALWPVDWNLPAFIAAIVSMGMLNAVVEQVNGLPIGLTYVTGALSRFGRGLGRWLLGERYNGWRVQLVPWSGMLLGAAVGAFLEHHLGLAAMAVSAALASMLAAVVFFIPRSWQLGYMSR
ncbi:YoaK family protein [Pseudomonas sp. GD04087]|uniref:YoaK family protein n=1 Tax=unclassified Pseudomonas TaxID=196821 RepID=UPI002447DB7C|nr:MULTISPECIES: YoaK family protein [unclassified Pseudomonas]MDH0288643.1 YoaK family protein [Pseudomonas sp. GD04087]MDH1049856.1 YoaK family protein [Pseudomonas sp. GD03903]MDH1998123.1 YoaK family protein [Pseudomonas sp. GD03691]